MLKSEYDRNYNWVCKDDPANQLNSTKKKNVSEPLMDHKRRVKLTEDNVLIGAPLTSQKISQAQSKDFDNAYFLLGKQNERFSESSGFYKPRSMLKQKRSRSKSPVRRKHLINEAVQTIDRDEKMVQTFEEEFEDKENQRRTVRKNRKLEQDGELKINRDTKSAAIKPNQTEYQRNYEPKFEKRIIEKPTIDRKSENRSKMDLKLKIYSNFMSEYQRQYKPYEYVTENQYRRMRPTNEGIALLQKAGAPSSQLQFIPDVRPRRAITPPPSVARSSPSPEPPPAQHTNLSMTQPTRPPAPLVNSVKNPQQLHFPHGSSHSYKFKTEYSENFDNKWTLLNSSTNADHHELDQQPDSSRSMQHSKWFKEILDLRKKAKEYKNRSRGTHLSREHLGQVFMKNDNRGRRSRSNSGSPAKRSRSSSPSRDRRIGTSISTGRSSISSSSTIKKKKIQELWNKQRTAGKPSYDNNLLLDEEASHDTERKEAEENIIEINDYEGSEEENEDPDFDVEYRRPISKQTLRRTKEDLGSEDGYRRPLRRTNVEEFRRPITKENLRRTYEADNDYEEYNRRSREKKPIQLKNQKNQTIITNPEMKYTFQKYFNPEIREARQNSKTLDYEEISEHISNKSKSLSTQSIISSSTMSLAKETLERARRNRDEILRQKV